MKGLDLTFPTQQAVEAEEKAGEGGSPLTDGSGARCAIFDVGKPQSERVRIKNPRIYVFLVVGSRVMGWASLFYDLNSILPLGAGGLWGLRRANDAVRRWVYITTTRRRAT